MPAPPRSTIPTVSELPLVLATKRLTLRPYMLADVDALWPHVSDPRLPPQMSWNAHANKDETRAFVQRCIRGVTEGNGITWAILHDNELVGAIGLHGITFKHIAWRVDRAELGYWVGIPFHRRGFMTEAATEVVRFAFETLGLHKITVGCLDGNDGSRKIIERLGFRFIGRREDDVWRDGAWHAHLRYELLASSYSDITTTIPVRR
ncbi:MAG: GNAT family N-acetyltransferase [Kofleriaceae bacterium]